MGSGDLHHIKVKVLPGLPSRALPCVAPGGKGIVISACGQGMVRNKKYKTTLKTNSYLDPLSPKHRDMLLRGPQSLEQQYEWY